MGGVLAKFRKKKTTAEILENLEGKIQDLEKYTINTQEQQKRFVFTFVTIAVGLYTIAFIAFCFFYFPPTWQKRIVYSVPLLLFPLVIFVLRKLLTWYFQRKLNKNAKKLSVLRDEKKEILEQVMDKETYKVALNLLKRYGDRNTSSRTPAVTPRITNNNYNSPLLSQTPRSTSGTSINSLSIRNTPSMGSLARNPSLAGGPVTPITRAWNVSSTSPAMSRSMPMPMVAYASRTSPGQQQLRRRTPFPIVNQQEKGVFERIFDVLIGDGPQDRFAMICKDCYAHNGMALKEEFEYSTFRCAFCNALNPARKERPVAPALPTAPHLALSSTATDTSDSSSDSESDDESNAQERPTRDDSESQGSPAVIKRVLDVDEAVSLDSEREVLTADSYCEESSQPEGSVAEGETDMGEEKEALLSPEQIDELKKEN